MRTVYPSRRGCSTTAAMGVLALALLVGACESPRDRAQPADTSMASSVPSRPDSDILRDIEGRYEAAPGDVGRNIVVNVQSGRVLLTGRARTQDLQVEAVRNAWQVDGVQEVINEIQVDEDEASLGDRATDARISFDLRRRLLFDGDIRSSQYTIETINQVIYIMGRARSQAELDRVLAHARQVPRARQVVNHVRV